MPNFERSGGGNGGPVDPANWFVISSTFWNYCNGNVLLYYVYIVLTKHGCLKVACSAVDEGNRATPPDRTRDTPL